MKKGPLNILYLGDSAQGTTSLQRCMALRSLGHRVTMADSAPRSIGLLHRVDDWLYRKGFSGMGHRSPATNRQIRQELGRRVFDLLWIDKGIYITPETIAAAKAANPGLLVLGYSPDYMAARHNNSRWFIAHSASYDLFVTTKSYAVEWHKAIGTKDVLFVGNAYDPATHRPMRIAAATRKALGGPVGFIGFYEAPRAEAVAYLGAHGVPTKVYSPGWDTSSPAPGVTVVARPLFGDDYAKAINAFDINLCFLRAMNLDVQTQRSVEIPACGAFMLAERTAEHQGLFKEGIEADFFSSKEELLSKCRFYLANPAVRKRVALAGYRRCLRSGYSNQARMEKMIEHLLGSVRGRGKGR
ncbi:MAG TPA: glycosyltransferase [bacterium]|jgi:spore maturation protein CgeB|nr:glycosyltransferase [bacterium]